MPLCKKDKYKTYVLAAGEPNQSMSLESQCHYTSKVILCKPCIYFDLCRKGIVVDSYYLIFELSIRSKLRILFKGI